MNTSSLRLPGHNLRIILFLATLQFTVRVIDAAFAKRGGWENRPRPTPGRKNVNTEERQPWDAMRFFKQSSKFVSVPTPFQRKSEKITLKPGDVIWEPGMKCDWKWSPLDDVVMGGASESTFDNETGMWTGTVTSANSGGFIGVRTTPFSQALDASACKGIVLTLRGGNKKRFKVIVRDSTNFNGVCWTTSFDAKGVVKVPFDKQVPTIFANTFPGQDFKDDNILGLQLTYSKFEYDGDLNPNFALGDVSLQVTKIAAY